MKLVETLVVRDEADIVDAQIRYHLNAGVDFVIATDHGSVDGTTDILESFAREGHLRRIAVEGEMHDGPWRTRMARLAATEHGADWVINTDADEFWLPRDGSLKEIFAAVPEPYGVVFALSRHFVPRPDDERSFVERMTVRVSSPFAINDPTSPYRPHLKAAHRGDPEISVRHGSHGASSAHWETLHHWYPFDVLHFPFRSTEQWERKGVRRARGDSQLGQYVVALLASEAGRAAERYAALVVSDEELERGIALGVLAVDGVGALPRDARNGETTIDSGVIAEGAAVRDADVVRLHRHADDLTARVAAVEARTGRIRSVRAPVHASRRSRRALGLPLPDTMTARRPVVALASAAALVLIVLLIFVALPEAFGDRPYDPRPSHVFAHLLHVTI